MKKTIVLLMAAGLSLAACGKHDGGDNAALGNTDVTVNDTGTDTLGGTDNFSDNTALPLDESNGASELGNGADALGNGSGATGNAH